MIRLKEGTFLAMDSSGAWYAYHDKPTKDSSVWDSSHTNSLSNRHFTNLPQSTDWEQSLHIINAQGEAVPYIERPDIAIDTPVWVRDFDGDLWNKAHFAGWPDDNGVFVWACGLTSFTSDSPSNKAYWDQYSLTDPNEA